MNVASLKSIERFIGSTFGDSTGAWSARSRKSLSGFLVTALLALFLLPEGAQADVIHVNTGNENKPGVVRGAVDPGVTWNYTGDFDDSRFDSYVWYDPQFSPGPTTLGSCHMLGGDCRLGINNDYGPDVDAGYPSYLGVQFFYLTFDLPAGATDVSLLVNDIGADDRVGLHLNGNNVAYWGNQSSGPQTGRIDGSDVYAATTLGAGSQPGLTGITLQDPFHDSAFTLNDTSLFNIGGTNVIRLWVNNTNSRSPSAPARSMSRGDPSLVSFDGVLSYEVGTIPEPWTIALMGLGLAGLGYSYKKKSHQLGRR